LIIYGQECDPRFDGSSFESMSPVSNALTDRRISLTMKPMREPTLSSTNGQPSTMKEDKCWYTMMGYVAGECCDSGWEDVQRNLALSNALVCHSSVQREVLRHQVRKDKLLDHSYTYLTHIVLYILLLTIRCSRQH
jgi:hypothetical protein